MSLLQELSSVFGAAFVAVGLDASDGEVSVSQRPELAQFQCNGALGAAKRAGQNPRELAKAVIEALQDTSQFTELSIAGPGFINISLTDAALAERIESRRQAEDVDVNPADPAVKMIIDYGGTNVAKAPHIGHLRPAVIGESLKRIMLALGHDVTGDVHLGDWGAPMGQLIAELELRQPDLPYFDADYSGTYPKESPVVMADFDEMYPAAAARVKDDPAFAEKASQAVVALHAGRPGYRALWQHFRDISVDALKEVFDDLGVEFDLWYGESTIHDRLEPLIGRMLADGIARESDGAVVVDVQEPDDNKEYPPLLMAKSDGATLYSSWDVATIEDRVDKFDAKVMLYVVDVRQSLHFEQVFRAARRAGIVGDDVVLEHPGNGTINGPDGKPLKTRAGGTPPLRGVMDEAIGKAAERLDENDLAANYDAAERARIAELVGLAALKYGELQNHRASDYIFDLDRFVSFEGRTGPYLLYSAVRMKSILRKAADQGLEAGGILPAANEYDRNLMLEVLRLPEVLSRAAEHRAPNHVALYAYELAAQFSRFFEHCHILSESDKARQASWLGLVVVCLRVMTFLLDLLVLEVPERM